MSSPIIDYMWWKLIFFAVAAAIYGFWKGLKGKDLDDD